jgi:hypothetical protein
MDLLDLAKLSVAFLMSAGFALSFMFLLRRYDRPWALYVLAILPVVLVYLLVPNQRVYGNHGLMHLSFVYSVMNGIPPESPVMAGEPLLYFWAHHLLVGNVSALFQISASNAFAIINVLSLLMTLHFLARTANHLTSDRAGQLFAVFVSIFAVSFIELNRRSIPVLEKFSNVNSMPLGIAFFALFLYCCCRVAVVPTDRERELNTIYPLLCLSIVGEGLFYPLVFLGVVACSATVGLMLIIRHGMLYLRRIVASGICVAIGGGVVVPYLLAIGAHKAPEAAMSMHGIGAAAYNLFELAVTLVPVGAIAYWQRDALRTEVRSIREGIWVLFTVVFTTAVMYALIDVPTDAGYKYFMLSCIAFGLVAGPGLGRLFVEKPRVAFAAATLLLIPMSADLLTKGYTKWQWGLANNYVEDGQLLRHANAEEDKLYAWITTNTGRDAIFIDSVVTIPVFARRSLYIAPHNRPPRPDKRPADGWTDTDVLLEKVLGYAPELIRSRRTLVAEVYADTELSGAAKDELRQIGSRRQLFIVARDRQTIGKLKDLSLLSAVYEGTAATVFKVRDTPIS